jgi:hypothetical protein
MYRITLYLLIWLLWLRNGKDVLLIYSNSPIWHEYMTTRILPLVQQRATVLNWSERKNWQKWALAVRVFHMFSSGHDLILRSWCFGLFVGRSHSDFSLLLRIGSTEKLKRLNNYVMN